MVPPTVPLPRNIRTLQEGLLRRTIDPEELVEAYLHQIEHTRGLNIYIEVYEEEARKAAGELKRYLQSAGALPGRLSGVVLSVKDVLCRSGYRVSAASKMLEQFDPGYTATAIQRLESEGAILIGRVNCDEFAMGSTNETSFYGPVRNPLDPKRVPGGSSGGSAAAVAAGTCLASIGSDTGGSVRQPAAFCGRVGFKPTYGRISRHGLIAYASSFDQIGTIGNDPWDMAVLLEVMAGPDAFDGTLVSEKVDTDPICRPPEKDLVIGFFPEALDHPGMDTDIRNRTESWMQEMEKRGVHFRPFRFPYLDFLVPAYYILTTAEASSNLGRYDGVRYGYRAAGAHSLEELYARSRTEGFGPEVQRRILLGTFVLSSGYYDAYYRLAQKARSLFIAEVSKVLSSCSALMMPASPVFPWRQGALNNDPVTMYLADIYTVLANLCGLPAISFPVDRDTGQPFPVSIQLMGRRLEDLPLLAMAEHLMGLNAQPET